MIPALALVALIADPSVASSMTATAGVGLRMDTPPALAVPLLDPQPAPPFDLELRWDTFTLRGSRRLELQGRASLGLILPALSSTFALWSLSIPASGDFLWRSPLAGAFGDNGLLVARFGYGLYLGSLSCPRGELFAFHDQTLARLFGSPPTPMDKGVNHGIGIEGTLFLTRHFGLHFEARGGEGFFAGLSLTYRPGPYGP